MAASDLSGARILIVDDEPPNVRLLERILHRAGYHNLLSVTDSSCVPEMVSAIDPDLILLDLHMPEPDGFAVMEQLRPKIRGAYLPILMLTADVNRKVRERALSSGAKDFLLKPFDISEVLLRVSNLLETRQLHARLQQERDLLEERVQERTLELEETQFEVLRRLAQAAEFRDDETGHHTYRVGVVATLIAGAMGLPASEVELIWFAAPLHDVGKIGIPDAVLLKPGRLTPEEMTVMQTHTEIGAKLLSGGRSACIRLAEQIALFHHERWDGTGYPRKRAGEQIPIAARIVALADFYDALSHDRPYRKAWTAHDIMAEIARQAGQHFDPRVVAAFIAVREDIDLQEHLVG